MMINTLIDSAGSCHWFWPWAIHNLGSLINPSWLVVNLSCDLPPSRCRLHCGSSGLPVGLCCPGNTFRAVPPQLASSWSVPSCVSPGAAWGQDTARLSVRQNRSPASLFSNQCTHVTLQSCQRKTVLPKCKIETARHEDKSVLWIFRVGLLNFVSKP